MVVGEVAGGLVVDFGSDHSASGCAYSLGSLSDRFLSSVETCKFIDFGALGSDGDKGQSCLVELETGVAFLVLLRRNIFIQFILKAGTFNSTDCREMNDAGFL